MQVKNQVSLTRKIIYGMMLLWLFLSAFGARSLISVGAPSGRKQAATRSRNEKSIAFSGIDEGTRANMHEDTSVTATPILPVQVTVVVGPGTEMSIEEMQTREASLNNTHLKGPTLSPVVPSQTPQSPQSRLILAGLIGLAFLAGAGLWVMLKRPERRN